jgi:plasmid stabilization system protein ParE
MKTSDGHGAVLLGALRELQAFWEHTSASWNDEAREHFEKDFLREVADAVRMACGAIGEIEGTLRTIRKECS